MDDSVLELCKTAISKGSGWNTVLGALIAMVSGLTGSIILGKLKDSAEHMKSARHVAALHKAFTQSYYQLGLMRGSQEKTEHLKSFHFFFDLLDKSLLVSPYPHLIDEYIETRLSYMKAVNPEYPAIFQKNIDNLYDRLEKLKRIADQEKDFPPA